jgi:hypothetical protein
VGVEECPLCKGKKVVIQHEYIGPEKTILFLTTLGIDAGIYEKPEDAILPPHEYPDLYKDQAMACPTCKGCGEVTAYKRTAEQVKCPKEKVLKDLLDEHDDVGRIVIYAGFTGSVERCIKVVKSAQWDYIRFDGQGCSSSIDGLNQEGLLKAFQDNKEDYKRIAFIGQAGAAGMGLTLTASPTIVYYSNDFNAESRIQSEDRIHRPGMDTNLGATIIDIFHLGSDKYVYDNLKKKKRLQDMSLGELSNVINSQEHGDRVT